jgi:hypothetical protein
VPPVDDRSSRRRRSRHRPPPPMHADPHGRLIADEYDAPRGRQPSPYHNRSPRQARAPTVASFEESPTVSSNAPLLAPHPQLLAVAIREPPRLVKQSSSGGSSSSGNSIEAHRHQVQEKEGQGRKRRPIPPPQPIPVPGAPQYSQPGPPPMQRLPHQQQMHDGPMTSHGPSWQFASSTYTPPPHSSPQGPRDFANPNHFRYRPKILSVPTPLAPHMQGTGPAAPSSSAASMMMMSPPYQTQEHLATYSHHGAAPSAPLHPSASPYQSHWRPFTPEPPPPLQLYQQQQVQVRQRAHQYSRSEPPMIEFPSPSSDDPLPSTQDGSYTDARRFNSNPGRGMQLLPAQATLSPPSPRGHSKSTSAIGPAGMNASTIARILQAQRGNSANASSTSLNNLHVNANASSTSLVQHAQAQSLSQAQPLVQEVRTNTHWPDSRSPDRHAPHPYTQAQPSSRPRVLRKGTPPPPPQVAPAPILVRSNSPSPGQVRSQGYASSGALLEGSSDGHNSSSSNVSTNTPMPAARKIAFDVPHGPEQDPPAAAAAPKKRRHRGRPTNPEDNMLVDPFGFTITENTPYDVIDKVTAGVSIVRSSLFLLG